MNSTATATRPTTNDYTLAASAARAIANQKARKENGALQKRHAAAAKATKAEEALDRTTNSRDEAQDAYDEAWERYSDATPEDKPTAAKATDEAEKRLTATQNAKEDARRTADRSQNAWLKTVTTWEHAAMAISALMSKSRLAARTEDTRKKAEESWKKATKEFEKYVHAQVE